MTEKHQPENLQNTSQTELNKIVLFNDDFNTFDYVIELLMRYCKHTMNQAEQCAMLTHYKGKSVVKKGTFDELEPIANTLLDKGLSVEIE